MKELNREGSGAGTAIDDAAAVHIESACVHNLKNVTVSIPLGSRVAICGVSGSGKSSLAFDCLHAEGQRRFMETFAPSAISSLNRLPAPDVERIDHLPPTIALREETRRPHPGSTLASLTEIHSRMAMLFATAGVIHCQTCGEPVTRQFPSDVMSALNALPAGLRYQIGFGIDPESDPPIAPDDLRKGLIAEGFDRVIIDGETRSLRRDDIPLSSDVIVIVDRLKTGDDSSRVADSIELAWTSGWETCIALIEQSDLHSPAMTSREPVTIDGREWIPLRFDGRLVCPNDGTEYTQPEPRLFRTTSPVGACSACKGKGEINVPAGRGASIDSACESCSGTGLNPHALAVRVEGKSFIEWQSLTVDRLAEQLVRWAESASDSDRQSTALLRADLQRELDVLRQLGLHAIPVNRKAVDLSDGERQRASLATRIARPLVSMLCLLDEPSSGLHPLDRQKVGMALHALQQQGNSVLLVEHAHDLIQSADHVIEIGPGAGELGGEVIYSGSVEGLRHQQTPTAELLRGATWPEATRHPRLSSGVIELSGCSARNLRSIDVSVPLGQLVVITGASGAGKTAFLEHCLLPSIEQILGRTQPCSDVTWQRIVGAEDIDDVMLIDRSVPGRSSRSNPATVIKLFDGIRKLFAETGDAKARGYTASTFSFNAKGGGRCPHCMGQGTITLELELLPSVELVCPECDGTRYRAEVREVTWRTLSISDVLRMTVGEAFTFFRGESGLQRKLQPLRDVGLSYLPLGQPTSTLSGGEIQRLKLASHLGSQTRKRTLTLIDEPAAGLHGTDVAALRDCLNNLIAVGHSVVIIEQAPELLFAADHVIELGPEGADAGGTVVFSGTPAEMLSSPDSPTGRYWSAEREQLS